MFTVEKYSPMEFQYLSKGKIKLDSAVAQLFHYEALGYLKVTNDAIIKILSLPDDAKGSNRIYMDCSMEQRK